MTNIDTLLPKCTNKPQGSIAEWNICIPQQRRQIDTLAFELLNTYDYEFQQPQFLAKETDTPSPQYKWLCDNNLKREGEAEEIQNKH